MLYTIPASYLLVVLDKNISKKQAELNEIQHHSKVSWHSRSLRELRIESRIETQFAIFAS